MISLTKGELRGLNNRVWSGETGKRLECLGLAYAADLFPVNASLDSSLKKNTAFIKRLRTAIAANAAPAFLQEIRSLSLHKYLSELTSASYEGLCRLRTAGEIAAGVEIISALHQRFGPAEFTARLAWHVGRGLTSPDKALLKSLSAEAREKEEKDRMSRQRVLLKLATELWLVGVLRSLDDVVRPEDIKGKDPAKTASKKPSTKIISDGEPFPLEALKELLGHDRDHANLPLAVLFVKSFAWDVLGIRPAVEARAVSDVVPESYDDSSEEESAEEAAALIPDELQQRFLHVLKRYFQDVKLHIVRDHESIIHQSQRNAEAYVRSGEIFEDRQASYDRQLKAQERLIANAQILCDALEGQTMPDLRSKENTAGNTASAGIGLVKTEDYLRGQAEGPGIWEDEEERRFYESLIDLKERVPAVLLDDSKKKDSDDQKKETDDPKKDAKKSEDLIIANKTVAAQVDQLIARLPELQNKDQVDQASADFCFVNSKASRNRLLKVLQDVPKGRSDLFPIFGRLIATVGRYLPDISVGMVAYLDGEFRSLQRRKQKEFLGPVRMGNIRYLAELTKFGVVPEHVIFHCYKVCLDDFSRVNIEIICGLLESCGRYLLRNPETAPRMSSFVETLQRKKAAQHLGQQERMMIENAIYYVQPPEQATIQQKERSPMAMYVSQLVYMDMNKRTYPKVLKSLRKLHWEEVEVVAILAKVFSKPWRVKYSNIYLLAILLSFLHRYHQSFVVTVIDNVMEQITLGLEQNDFRFSQRRLAEMRYVGELYNYKMLDSSVVFDTMYRVVTFGHSTGTPTPDKLNTLDLPDDFFRIRMVCTMLETCGVCFDRGPTRKKLDFFLTFFQFYIQTKESTPLEIEYLVQDTYATLRPDWKLIKDFTEAGAAFAEVVKNHYKMQEPERLVAEPEPPPDDSSEEDNDEEKLFALKRPHSSDSEAEAEDTVPSPGATSDFEDEIVVTRQEEERDPAAEAEFDRELQKLMSESLDTRKFERKPVFDMPLPLRRAARPSAVDSDGSDTEIVEEPVKTNTMAFSLMTKKGSKPQTRTVEMPANSTFAVALKTQQEAERLEQQRIKKHILNLDLQDLNGENDMGDGERHQHNASLSSRQPSSNAKAAMDKSSFNRRGDRARKLQLSDVDWT